MFGISFCYLRLLFGSVVVVVGISTSPGFVPLPCWIDLDSRDAGPNTESACWKKSEQGVIS